MSHLQTPGKAACPWTSVWLAAAMFAIPFAIGYHVMPVASFYNEIAAFALGLLALYPLVCRRHWQDISVEKVAVIWPALAVLVVVQYQFGLIPTPSQAFMYVCYLLWAACLTLLGGLHRKLFGLASVIRCFCLLIIGVAWFNLAYVGLQFLYKYGLYQPDFLLASGFGAISQANHFASFNAIAIACLLYLDFLPSRPGRPAWAKAVSGTHFYLALTAFTAMLAISGSRSAWLYLGAMLLFALWLARGQAASAAGNPVGNPARTSARRIVTLTLLLLPAFALLQWLMATFAHAFVTTAAERMLEFTDASAVGGWKMRLAMWQQSLQLFMQQPWLGTGLAQTRGATYAWTGPLLASGHPGSYEHPHNLVVQLLSETGLTGALLVLLPLACWCLAFFRQPDSPEKWWLLSLFAVFAIHSLLEYPLNFAYYLGFAAYLLGLAQVSTWHFPVAAPLRHAGRAVIALCLVAGLALCWHTLGAYQKIDRWMRLLAQNQFSLQHIEPYYDTLAWLNEKSLLAAYSYPMFLLAIEHLPLDNAGKQAVNALSLRILPMPKSAYLQPLYLLQQQKKAEALQAMRLAVRAYPDDYRAKLRHVPPALLDDYVQLYEQARQTQESASP